jgi:hypothetical protein
VILGNVAADCSLIFGVVACDNLGPPTEPGESQEMEVDAPPELVGSINKVLVQKQPARTFLTSNTTCLNGSIFSWSF